MRRLKLRRQRWILIALVICALAVVIPMGIKASTFSVPTPSDISIKVQCAAYDQDHAVVNYTIQGPLNVPSGYLPIWCPISKTQLVDASGNDLSGKVFTSCRPNGNDTYAVTQIFYNPAFSATPPAVLKISVGDIDLIPGGGGQGTHLPLISTYSINGHFTQTVNMTYRPEASLSQNGISQNGLTLTGKRVDLSPALIKIDACLTLPDTGDWHPYAYLRMGNQTINADEWFIPDYKSDPSVLNNINRCFSFLVYSNIQDFRSAPSGSIVFGISEIATGVPECLEGKDYNKIQDVIAKQNLAVHLDPLDPTGRLCLNTVSNPDLLNVIQQYLPTHVKGPWEFTVQ